MLNRTYIISLSLGILGISLLILIVTNSITSLGKNIPQYDVINDYALGLLWCIIWGLSIFIWPVSTYDKLAILTLWLIKSLVVIGFILLFEAYYPSLDAYSYFSIPRQPDFIWTGFSVTDGTGNIMNLVWLYYRLMPESYHALKVTFAMVGLVAVYIFYKAAVLFLRKRDIRIFYILGLFPSILFWSSILGKEPIGLLGIAFFAYGLIGWYQLRKLPYIGVSLIGLLIVVFIRIWLGVILLFPTVIMVFKSVKSIFLKLIITASLIILFVIILRKLKNWLAIETVQDILIILNTWSKAWSIGGSGQEINADLTKIDQVIKFIPLGIFTSLFRPLPGEVLNPFGLLAGLENLVILILLSRATIRTRWKDFKNPIVLWSTLLILTWSTVYSFISYQNLGSAVRFKVQILPVLLGLLFYLGQQRKIFPKSRFSLAKNEVS